MLCPCSVMSVFRNLVSEYPFNVRKCEYLLYKALRLYSLVQYMVFGTIETYYNSSSMLLLFLFTNIAYNT